MDKKCDMLLMKEKKMLLDASRACHHSVELKRWAFQGSIGDVIV
jgi:hypothetical protein